MIQSWASEAAMKLKQRDESHVREYATTLEKRKLIEKQGFPLWREVLDHVKIMCAELNAECGEGIVNVEIYKETDLRVQFRHGDAVSEVRATCEFSPSAHALQWFYLGPAAEVAHPGKYRFDVSNGVVALQNSRMPSCRESIARQMLDGLLMG
jgi:hypothetical protein